MTLLPSSWATAQIGEVCDKIVDGSHNPPAGVGDGLPMLSARNILTDGLDLTEIRRLKPEDFRREDSRTQAREGDVLLTIVGSIGRAHAISATDGPMTFQRSVAVLHAIGLSPKYCCYQFQSPHFQRQLEEAARGTAQKGVYLKSLAGLALNVAPRGEQDLIVAEIEKQFTRLDAATVGLKRVQANLKRYRGSVLKAACEGRLVPTEAELARKEGRDYEPADQLLQRILRERRAGWEADTLAKMIVFRKPPRDDRWKTRYKDPVSPVDTGLPTLPSGWVWATADQITSLITDGEHITPERTDSGVYLLSARNVRDGEFSLDTVDYISPETYEQLCRRLRIVAGDVLLSCSGSVGRSCVVPDGVQFGLVRSVAVLKPLVIRPEYLSFALRSGFVQEQIRTKSTQTAQANIFQAQIKSLVLPLPPLSEQNRIVEVCSVHVDEACRLGRQIFENVSRADRLRQAVLASAFSGRLLDQNADDEPASALLDRARAYRVSKEGNGRSRRREEPAYA